MMRTMRADTMDSRCRAGRNFKRAAPSGAAIAWAGQPPDCVQLSAGVSLQWSVRCWTGAALWLTGRSLEALHRLFPFAAGQGMSPLKGRPLPACLAAVLTASCQPQCRSVTAAQGRLTLPSGMDIAKGLMACVVASAKKNMGSMETVMPQPQVMTASLSGPVANNKQQCRARARNTAA